MRGIVLSTPRFRIYGDTGLLMEFGETIAPEINDQVHAIIRALDASPLQGVVELVPAYRSLLIIYDASLTDVDTLKRHLLATASGLRSRTTPAPHVIDIPVCYGGPHGPDIEKVARHHAITADEVVRLHSAPTYPIYMLGFTPGFPFLGGMSERLFTPRLETPRPRVPAGSVGIANNQTGIYPIESPGGWCLIGRTPLRLFDVRRAAPFSLKAGACLKFIPISADDYEGIKRSGAHDGLS